MPSYASSLPSLIPFVFGLLAFVFSLLAITSHDWAFQAQYASNTDVSTQFKPIYTLYRSPFQICTEIVVNGTDNTPHANASANGGDDPEPTAPPNRTYYSSCHRYRAFGFNQTSCELATATNSSFVLQVGDRRQCQQIHYAGNYSIASTVFISLAFVLAIGMVFMAFFKLDPVSEPANAVDEEHAEAVETTAAKGHHKSGKHRHAHHAAGSDATPSALNDAPAAPFVNLLVITFFIIGVTTAVIAQFYGVLAFVQSAPNNGDFITSTGNFQHHDPWVQGKALSVYMTLSWGFAAAAGFGAWMMWSLPGIKKVI